MSEELPPYTVAVLRSQWVLKAVRLFPEFTGEKACYCDEVVGCHVHREVWESELIAVKRVAGHWDVIGANYWFIDDDNLFEEWPEYEIVGEGIWPEK